MPGIGAVNEFRIKNGGVGSGIERWLMSGGIARRLRSSSFPGIGHLRGENLKHGSARPRCVQGMGEGRRSLVPIRSAKGSNTPHTRQGNGASYSNGGQVQFLIIAKGNRLVSSKSQTKHHPMRAQLFLKTVRNKGLQISLGLSIATVALSLPQPLMAQGVDLGTAQDFVVLAGAGITNTGSTTLFGNVGTHPTPSITGFNTVTLDGVIHGDNAVSQQAKLDLLTAYNDAAGRPAPRQTPMLRSLIWAV